MFKISLQLAKFADMNIFDLRRTDAEEVLYLFRCLTSFDLSDEAGDVEARESLSVEYKDGVQRVQRFADQVKWFDD